MKKAKLYPCCNTCKHHADNRYSCAKPSQCFNGFSAYEPNAEMVEQEKSPSEEMEKSK